MLPSSTRHHARTGRLRRLLAAAALVVVPAVALTATGTAEAATTTNRVDAAAGWLGRQLDPDTNLITTSYGGQTYPDYGVTADVVLALDAAKVGRPAARRATKALKKDVLAYTGGGDQNEFYAGAFAKLVLVAVAQGTSPRSFGSGPRQDLVAGLLALECGTKGRTDCAATDKGRFSDRTQYADFSNPITQSLALVGLERATSRGPSPASVAYLIGQQCPNGAFPQTFGADACTPSVDSTAFAVQALTAVGSASAKAKAAAADAGRWLARHQHANGSFSGDGTRNANSTALAAQALAAVGRGKAAARARHFVRSLQVRCGGRPAARGLVRYTRHDRGDAVRATSQAVPALARVSLAEVSISGSATGLPRLSC